MKNGFSIEFKIILAVTAMMLAIVTVVVVQQIFKTNHKDVTFVYNSAQAETIPEVNISDIFSEM